MHIVDQRIQIPTTASAVWEYIRDIARNPSWQVDCRSVTFLTSKRGGPGTRWRQETDKGREQVVEITAWYEGLGYQYTYIDGTPFRESTGRIRLQEIPEGTIVQWTLTYELGGMLGGVRGSLGFRRSIERAMTASLRALTKEVAGSARGQVIQTKSLMRDAPSAEARAQYTPRHPVAVNVREEGAQGAGSHLPPRPIAEPPVAEDDTRPRPAISVPRSTIDDLVAESEEPEFLEDIARFAPPADYLSDTQPVRTIRPEDLPAEAAPSQPANGTPVAEPAKDSTGEFTFEEDDDLGPPPTSILTTDEFNRAIDDLVSEANESAVPDADAVLAGWDGPTLIDAAPPAAEAEAAEKTGTPDSLAEKRADAQAATLPRLETDPAQETEPHEPPKPEPALSIDLSPLETATISIWDVFGVPKPSETLEIPPAPEAVAAPAETGETPPPATLEPAALPVETGETPPPAAPEPAPVQPVAVEAVTVDTPPVAVPQVAPLPAALPGNRRGLRLALRHQSVRLRRPA